MCRHSPHEVGELPSLDASLGQYSAAEVTCKGEDEARTQHERRPVGRHVRGEDVVSTAPPSYLPTCRPLEGANSSVLRSSNTLSVSFAGSPALVAWQE
jgi:hypothetical protein